MKRVIYPFVIFLALSAIARGQNSEFTVQDYHPESPTAFQFLKYTELPVSEYTGIPNISVPVYTIKEDGLEIPLKLTYHSNGFRVSEEAGWVGLGWDLSVGSIVQQINTGDDYATINLMQPDYQNIPIPTDLPFRYAWGSACPACNGSSWSNPYPIFSSPTQYYGYAIATDYFMPINGNFDDQYDGEGISNQTPGLYDSDPDIFHASFLGHEITFIRNFKNGQIVVLNRPGYAVTRTGNNYEIVVPSGEQYYFQQCTTTTYQSYTGSFGNVGTPTVGTASKVWMLTKIVTKHKKQVLLNYTQTDTVDNYPSYSERWDSAIAAGVLVEDACSSNPVFGFVGGQNGLGLDETFGYTTENRLFLSSITFPNGEVDFSMSARTDLLGGQRLDSVQIKTSSVINTFRLSYDYFNSAGVVSDTFKLPLLAAEFGQMPKLRLELLSVKDNSGSNYLFSYNPLPLPAKNSLAQDFWGFYNGQVNNRSIIPNSSRMNIPFMGNNGNNNSASPYCVQACLLEKIQYPTGGTDSLEYELNQFSNYLVPDSASTTNTISSGNGVRIHALDYRPLGSVNARRTVYTYSGGVDIVPLHVYGAYSTSYDLLLEGATSVQISTFNIDELYARGFYSSNALASINGVGYGEVIKQDVASDGTTNGRVETYYSNVADNVSNTGLLVSQVAVSLPATKIATSPENGSVLTALYYDNQNNLLKQVANTYTNVLSNYYYGARLFGYGDYSWVPSGLPCPGLTVYPQTLIAFYPIFDFQTLLTGTTTTEYAGPDSLVTTEGYNYDSYNQLYISMKYNPSYYQQTWFEYPYSNNHYNDVASQQALLNDHQLSEVVFHENIRGAHPWQNALADSAIKHYVVAPNGAVVESSMSIYKNLLVPTPIPDSVNYDLYDSTYSNLLQYTHKDMTNSLIWGYNGEYLIAEVKNASKANVAYTSFENAGSGNWIYGGTSTADSTSPTGSYCYSLGQTGGGIVSGTLGSANSYIVSYWIKASTPLTIAGTVAGYPVQGKTINGWTYFEHKITGQTKITVSGTASIDELRLYPSNAQMTTYTFAPLVGMTYQCDVNNRVTRYDYDAFKRLKDIRDQDGNITKTYQYHYQGQ
jgi:YD repeat-containing protein